MSWRYQNPAGSKYIRVGGWGVIQFLFSSTLWCFFASILRCVVLELLKTEQDYVQKLHFCLEVCGIRHLSAFWCTVVHPVLNLHPAEL